MKKVLCYGDSNTWGFISGTNHERYDESVRYTKVLQKILGTEFEVIEEGLPGRTCCTDDIKECFGNINGELYFAQSIYSHLPLDYIVLMLGTNDLKTKFDKAVSDCADALKNKYIKPIIAGLDEKLNKMPKIVVVTPAKIEGSWGKFDGADEKSLHFNDEYKKVATENDCLFVSNEGLVNGVDKIHLTKESHLLLAERIAKTILDNEK